LDCNLSVFSLQLRDRQLIVNATFEGDIYMPTISEPWMVFPIVQSVGTFVTLGALIYLIKSVGISRTALQMSQREMNLRTRP